MKIDPPAASVSFWLKSLSKDDIHEAGWIEVNLRFHGITRAARAYINENYTDDADKQAAFDGFTMALLAVAHFEDIEQIQSLFEHNTTKHKVKSKQS